MLKQKFLVQFGSNFIIQIIAIVAGIVVARVAGPEVIGTIAFGTAYISVWSFVNGLFSTGHIKMISEGRNLGNCVTTYSYLQGGSLILYFILVAGWFLAQKYIYNYSFESTAVQLVIIILLFANIAAIILDFNNVTFTARLEQVKANFPYFIKAVIWQIGRVVVVLMGFKAIGLASWNLVVSILVLPLAWKLYKQLPAGNFDREIAKKYWSFVPPVALIAVVNNITNYADKLFLSHYTNVTELGYYSAAFAIGGMFLLVARSTGQIFFPLFSQMISKEDWKGINDKITGFQDFAGLFIFPLMCAFAIAGEPFLIAILGERYQPSVIPFKILLFATYVAIVGMPYGNIITGMGRFYLSAMINLFQLVLFIISITFFLSPKFMNLGATGLAFNLLTLNITNNLFYIIIANRLAKISIQPVTYIRYLIPITIGLITYYLKSFIQINEMFFHIILAITFLILVYLLLLILGLLKRSHLVILSKLLNPSATVKYIQDEMRKK